MSILTGAQCSTVKAAAVAYSIDGFSVVPLSGKKPANGVLWQPYQKRRADIMDIARWDKQRILQNVGIVCGDVSGNLIVMDCDSMDACDLFERAFPVLRNTFTINTGSGKGRHYYYRVQTLPPTTRAMNIGGGNLELRANGCYVVAAPSIHPDTGNRYSIHSGVPMLQPLDVTSLVIWLHGLMKTKQQQQAADQAARPAPQPVKRTMLERGTINNPAAYGNAAIRKEISALMGAPEGSRNNQLNQSAYNLGQLVGDGILAQSNTEAILLTQALAIGLEEGESIRTIQSGLRSGISATRSGQWHKRTR